MKQLRPIVLFEPVARGSRLHILANMVSSIRSTSNRKIIIITRYDYLDSHFYEVMKEDLIEVKIVQAATDLGGAWIKILSLAEFSTCLVALYSVVSVQDCDVVFMALDEYLVAFGFRALEIRRRLKDCRVWIIKYRVEYLFSYPINSVRNMALNIVTRWSLSVSRSKLVCFDERFNGRVIGCHAVEVIPDPWFGNFDPMHRMQGRTLYNIADNDFVILTLGRQDRRKGIHVILGAATEILKIPGALLFIVGKIDVSFASAFAQLINDRGDRIKYIKNFVTEAELPSIFACADVFLLPYSSDFTASSGTLSRAAASGIPVVTGTHGLVGYRVRQHGLGETFQIDDTEGFVRAIKLIKNYSEQKRIQVQYSLQRFAESSCLTRFKKRIGELFT